MIKDPFPKGYFKGGPVYAARGTQVGAGLYGLDQTVGSLFSNPRETQGGFKFGDDFGPFTGTSAAERGELGPVTQGQGVGNASTGWALSNYSDAFGGFLPGGAVAGVVGDAMLSDEMEDIDATFNAMGNTPEGYMSVSDEYGNINHISTPEYGAYTDAVASGLTAPSLTDYIGGGFKDIGVVGDQVQAQNRAGQQVRFANSPTTGQTNSYNFNMADAGTNGWNGGNNDSYGSQGEADAVANSGWGSDAHFDAIDAQFDSNDSSDSGGGK